MCTEAPSFRIEWTRGLGWCGGQAEVCGRGHHQNLRRPIQMSKLATANLALGALFRAVCTEILDDRRNTFPRRYQSSTSILCFKQLSRLLLPLSRGTCHRVWFSLVLRIQCNDSGESILSSENDQPTESSTRVHTGRGDDKPENFENIMSCDQLHKYKNPQLHCSSSLSLSP